ncbi:MAG: HAD-IA family hydrolase [Deltaproteobacteria bacterium]|nr:HAD-IA family hydrolase [Deltaproteobacteria bacterium]
MSEIKALFFDQDGVIIDTEKDGHRVAFNETFKKFGYEFQWDIEKYHELLQISGGKERMRHYFQAEGFFSNLNKDKEDQLIADLHKAKTEIFINLIESGKLPLRPGIKRLMKEAMAADILLGICTTSNERAANTIAKKILKEIEFSFVLAGDIVSKKKPDPEIYLLALKKTGLKPEECVVVEDSRNGVLAAKNAGMYVIATTNVYTEEEDLSEADIIVTCLGDPDGEKGSLKKGLENMEYDGIIHAGHILKFFSG